MGTIGLIDYVKYNLFNMRTPELVEKMRLKEFADRIAKQKYHFVDFKTNGLSIDCAKFIYEMYKVIGPIIGALREEFVIKDGKQFCFYLIEDTFTDEQKALRSTFSREYMVEQIKKTSNPSAVFQEVKNNFIKFKDSMSGEKARSVNLMFNSLKDFVGLFSFDFFLFLKSFAPSLLEGMYDSNLQFRPNNSAQVIDDLVKLDYGIQGFVIKKEIFVGLQKFQEYKKIPVIAEKSIKSFFTRVKYLQTPGLLSDIIIYLLKDFTYKSTVTNSNFNIFIGYISDVTQNLKKDMDSIVSELKSDKVAALRNKVFSSTEIIRLANVNEERNEQLEKYDCLIFECVEPLQYVKTFVLEFFDRSYKEPLNELFLVAEFVNKARSSKGLDAFYIMNEIRDKINKFDSDLTPESENSKRLRGWLASPNKANANRDLIETLVKQFNEKGRVLILEAYNAVLDLTSIVKNVLENCQNGEKTEITNPTKIMALSVFTVDVAYKMQDDFDGFIALMKNFIR